MEVHQIFFWVAMAAVFFLGFFLARAKNRHFREQAQQERQGRIDELMGRPG